MRKVRYHEMLPHEIVPRRKKFPVAFVPVGGLEWHGEHNACGLDALKAEALCEMAARDSGGFCMPTLWYSDTRSHALMEASVDPDGAIKRKMKFKKSNYSDKFWGKTPAQQEEFYCSVAKHVLWQMYTLEMKVVIFFAGHFPMLKFAMPAVEDFNAHFDDAVVFAGCELDFSSDKRIAGGDHASKWETSYLWYLRPDCVDMSVYLGRENEPSLIGCPGEDPRKSATIEVGRKASEHVVANMVAKARQLLEDVNTLK